MLKAFTLLLFFISLYSSTSFGTDIITNEIKEDNIVKQQRKILDDQSKEDHKDTNKYIVIRQKSNASPDAIPMHENPQQGSSYISWNYIKTIMGY